MSKEIQETLDSIMEEVYKEAAKISLTCIIYGGTKWFANTVQYSPVSPFDAIDYGYISYPEYKKRAKSGHYPGKYHCILVYLDKDNLPENELNGLDVADVGHIVIANHGKYPKNTIKYIHSKIPTSIVELGDQPFTHPNTQENFRKLLFVVQENYTRPAGVHKLGYFYCFYLRSKGGNHLLAERIRLNSYNALRGILDCYIRFSAKKTTTSVDWLILMLDPVVFTDPLTSKTSRILYDSLHTIQKLHLAVRTEDPKQFIADMGKLEKLMLNYDNIDLYREFLEITDYTKKGKVIIQKIANVIEEHYDPDKIYLVDTALSGLKLFT